MNDTAQQGRASDENPRAVIGGNAPPIAEQMQMHYETLWRDAIEVCGVAERLPPVASGDDVKRYADHAKVIKGVTTRINAAEEKEKRPFMSAIDAVRGYFGAMHNKNGTGSLDKVLDAMRADVKTWQDAEAAKARREAEERARLAREEENRRMAAAAAAARKLAEEEATRRAVEAANAAQGDPTRSGLGAVQEAHAAVGEHLDAADLAGHQARIAEREAAQRPAETVRLRSAVGGGLATSTQFWDFEILDLGAIPPAALWPFITDAEKTKAVAAFVRAGNRELSGTRIFQNTRASFR